MNRESVRVYLDFYEIGAIAEGVDSPVFAKIAHGMLSRDHAAGRLTAEMTDAIGDLASDPGEREFLRRVAVKVYEIANEVVLPVQSEERRVA